jgi:hypothetical protein
MKQQRTLRNTLWTLTMLLITQGGYNATTR